MKENAKKPIESVLVVGGFSSSDYLFAEIKESLHHFGIYVFRPDGYLNKAVANGAVSFYIDHYVDTRISKFTYGNPCSYIYNSDDLEHVLRSSKTYTSISGKRYVKGAFDVILTKNTQVSETMEFRRSYWYTGTARDSLCHIKNEVYCYRGELRNPRWMDEDKDSYSRLCYVEADTTRLSRNLQPQQMRTGRKKKNIKIFYELNYDIVLSFGLTELKAQIAWLENGQEVRGPARIVYESMTT